MNRARVRQGRVGAGIQDERVRERHSSSEAGLQDATPQGFKPAALSCDLTPQVELRLHKFNKDVTKRNYYTCYDFYV